MTKLIVWGMLSLSAAVVHSWLFDGLHGAALAAMLGEDTAYAPGYTNEGFRAVRRGMTTEDVQELLGAPLGETWRYVPLGKIGPYDPTGPCTFVFVQGGRVGEYVDPRCQKRGVEPHMLITDVSKLMGSPTQVSRRYSESPSDHHYRERVIRSVNDRVSTIKAGFYWD